MKRALLCQTQVSKVLSHRDIQDFDHFLFDLRRAFGVTRRSAAEEMKFPYTKLVLLELGKFHRAPSEEELDKLSTYYDVKKDLLRDKAAEFLAKRKYKPSCFSVAAKEQARFSKRAAL